MVVKKSRLVGGIILSVFLISFLYFVFAIPYNEAPTDAGNGTTITMLIFNVSNTSAVGGTALNNITINLTGTASVENITNVTVSDGTTVWYTGNPSSSPFNVSIGSNIDGQTNFTINFTINSSATDTLTLQANVTHIYNETNISYSTLPYVLGPTIIDSLNPYIEYSSTTTAASNLSQNYIFVNISANDTVSNLDTIIIYLYNSTGEQNSSTNSSVGVTSAVQNFNFTGLSDGTYYINATVNDSYNHINDSLATRTIILDVTSPIILLYKTSSTTTSLTISISITEAGSGISGACTSNRGTVSGTGNSQTLTESGLSCSTSYSYNVTCTDYAGNSGSDTESFSTSSCGGSGTSTSPFWTSTYVYDDEEFSEQEPLTRELAIKRRIRVKIGGASHYVGVISLTSTTATINVSSASQQATLTIGDERKFDVLEDDYYDIQVTLNSIADDKANITIKSIHEEVTVETIAAETETETEAAAAEEEEEASKKWIWIVVIIVVVLIIIGGGYGLKKRRNELPNPKNFV